ncbi:MAG: hypothetical protein DPW09_24740 [Anaerolineae bacterium]|nr:hypothetical protein [Anaerolineae bacterium]
MVKNSKRWFSVILVSGLAVLLVGLLATAPALAQGPGGMMGNPGWMMGTTQGYTGTTQFGRGGMMNGGIMGHGMMGGPGFRGWGWMSGMGGNGWGRDGGGYAGCWDDGWGQWGMIPGRGYNGNLSAPLTTVSPTTTTAVSFKMEVQLIFDSRCVACHGGAAGLFLNNYENVLRGGMHGSVVIPGVPVSSRLIQYVSSGYMPAGGPPLTQAQIQTLVNWVAAGAPDN